MGLKLTEEQLKNMLQKNSKLKVSSVVGKESAKETLNHNNDDLIKIPEEKAKPKNPSKISLTEPQPNEENKEVKKKKKSSGLKISDINKLNKSAICTTSVSDEHISFLFNGAKLLSLNQIFAQLQLKFGQKQLFNYKKVWHDIIKSQLELLYWDLKSQNKKLPFFDTSVELTLFRQASRLVDEDAMSAMFKYIIDALKKDDTENPYGILAEDNPKIVHRIVCFSEKGEPFVGIKIKKVEEKKQHFSPEDILNK